MQNEIKCRFSQKHDIEANWIKAGNAENPFIPWAGELIIYDSDENYNYARFKTGDGITNVNDLPFVNKNDGIGNIIEGNGSSSFGIESIARGNAAHAEGYQVLAGAKSFKFNLEHEYTENDTNEGWYYLTSVEGLSDVVIPENIVEITDTKEIDSIISSKIFACNGTGIDLWEFNEIYGGENQEHRGWSATYVGEGIDPYFGFTLSLYYDYSDYPEEIDRLINFLTNANKYFKLLLYDDAIEVEYYENENGGEIYDGDEFYDINYNANIHQRIYGSYPTYSLRLENNYDFNGEVIKVDETQNRVKVTNYKIPVVGTGTEISEVSFFILPEYPGIGTENIIGYGAHAEGYETIAHSTGAHAEGWATLAAGCYSHAEGRQTKAGYAAHAEGRETLAKGENSHAEGQATKATGESSHAEGGYSEANAKRSHAEGSTVAASEFQHTQGKYNIIDDKGTYAHIVGNGTSTNSRSNAHTLDWEGNAWFAGDVTIGKDKEKLATEAYCGYSRDIWFIPYGAQESCLFRFDTTAKTLTVRAIRILSPKLIDIATETVLSLEGISNNPNFLIFDHEATSNEYLKIVKRDALKNLTTKYSVILTFDLSALTNTNNVSYKGPYSVDGVIYNKNYNDTAINDLISKGNAASATSAISDEVGNNIIETYATKAELTELEERLKEYIDSQIQAAITSALNTEV